MIFRIILKVLLWLLLLILILGLIICLSSVKISFSFWDKKLEWSVRYFGIKILPRKRKKKTSSETDAESSSSPKEEATEEISETSESEEQQKTYLLLMDKIWKKMQEIAQKMDKAGNVLYALPGAVRWFLKSIRICQLKTDFVIADEDAAVCAQNYGMMQTVMQMLSSLICVKKREISIRCDFVQDVSTYQIKTVIRVQIGTLIIAGLGFIFAYLKNKRIGQKAFISPKL